MWRTSLTIHLSVAWLSMQKPLQLDYQPGWGDANSNGYMNGEGPGHKQNLIS